MYALILAKFRRIKKFFLGSIGLLILSTNKRQAEKLLIIQSSFCKEKEMKKKRKQTEIACIACKVGPPGGAHKCFFVAINLCTLCQSVQMQLTTMKATGQKRLCRSCSENHSESAAIALSSNAIKNWRRLAIQMSLSKRRRWTEQSYGQTDTEPTMIDLKEKETVCKPQKVIYVRSNFTKKSTPSARKTGQSSNI